MYENDTLTTLEDEIPNTYHIISKKVGELGIVFKTGSKGKYVFKQTDTNKYLKPFHLIFILRAINKYNGVEQC